MKKYEVFVGLPDGTSFEYDDIVDFNRLSDTVYALHKEDGRKILVPVAYTVIEEVEA